MERAHVGYARGEPVIESGFLTVDEGRDVLQSDLLLIMESGVLPTRTLATYHTSCSSIPIGFWCHGGGGSGASCEAPTWVEAAPLPGRLREEDRSWWLDPRYTVGIMPCHTDSVFESGALILWAMAQIGRGRTDSPGCLKPVRSRSER